RTNVDTVRSNRFSVSSLRLFGRHDRQLEIENRAARCGPAIADASVVGSDVVVAPREPKAGAFADGLRRIERLEQLRLVLRRNTRAGILHLDPRPAVAIAGADDDVALHRQR